MLESVLTIPFWFEFAAVLAGSISGALSATRARYDLFGTMCISIVVGLVGGVIRDILLQDYGIYAFQKPSLILICVICALLAFYFGSIIAKLNNFFDPILDFIDALAVALWAIISVGKGLSAGFDLIPAVILGTITAVGGGITRDVLMNRTIVTFQAGSLYGSAALVGSIVFAYMKQHHILDMWSAFICVSIVLVLRYISVLFDLHSSPARDYSDTLTKLISKPARAIVRKTKPTQEIFSGTLRAKPVTRIDDTSEIAAPFEIVITKDGAQDN